MVGLPRNPDDFDVFDLDFAEAGRILVDHLAERGHREVILITPREHVYERGAYTERCRHVFRPNEIQVVGTIGAPPALGSEPGGRINFVYLRANLVIGRRATGRRYPCKPFQITQLRRFFGWQCRKP